jgi:hypothetical protein
MGKAGMKRKGRTHLPKAGTRPARRAQSHEHRARAAHPFTSNPASRRSTGWAIGVAILAVVVVIGIIGLMALA